MIEVSKFPSEEKLLRDDEHEEQAQASKTGENVTYMSVQAMIPGRPLWKSFQSQSWPKRGFSSTPIKKSYQKFPDTVG